MSSLTLVVQPRGKPIKGLPQEIVVQRDGKGADLYQQLARAAHISIHRLRINKGSDGTSIPNKKDFELGATGLGDQSTIRVKDLGAVKQPVERSRHQLMKLRPAGPQVAWKTVFIIEYIGPIIIHCLIYSARQHIYSSPNPSSPFPSPSLLQNLSVAMIVAHFIKRELETLFVHRFSSSTMPIFNIFRNSAHYWFLAGFNIAYWIYSPYSPTAKPSNPWITLIGVLLFAVGELGNLDSHLKLRKLRSAGGVERGIPQGPFFNLVTCPNYMFEMVAWVGILLVTWSWSIVLFIVVAVAQMVPWSKKKEMALRRDFGSQYKKKRFYMLPGIY
ncbi:3-oxo-5a-steroid 4- dehydrogenase [Bachmanniomyces sp. S44760]|nr:3-oxo-5a-steroid 4- dehydrogenase [Bachmanniomyces sp. S44760]